MILLKDRNRSDYQSQNSTIPMFYCKDDTNNIQEFFNLLGPLTCQAYLFTLNCVNGNFTEKSYKSHGRCHKKDTKKHIRQNSDNDNDATFGRNRPDDQAEPTRRVGASLEQLNEMVMHF